jgi:hypothetical protein
MLQDTYPFELPPLPHSEKKIINYDKHISEQVWKRPGPPANWKDLTPAKKEQWIEEETTRSFQQVRGSTSKDALSGYRPPTGLPSIGGTPKSGT